MCLEAETPELSDQLNIVGKGKGLFFISGLWNISKGYLCMGTIDWIFVSPQNPPVEILTLGVLALGGRAFSGWIGHEGGAFMSGISAPIELQRLPHPFHHRRMQPGDKRGGSPFLNLLVTWSWVSQPAKLWVIDVHCLSCSVFGIFVVTVWMDCYCGKGEKESATLDSQWQWGHRISGKDSIFHL